MWNIYELIYLGDLLSFDSPIISLFEYEKDSENYILYKSIEYIKESKDNLEKWICFKVSKKDLLMFFEKEFTLRKLFFDKLYSNNAMLSIINDGLKESLEILSTKNESHKKYIDLFAKEDSYFSKGYNLFAFELAEQLKKEL